jgi:DNA-binding transcriptional LysR family regulator
MNWDDLRFVLAVHRHNTLAAAGRDLGVDPTTVGRRILAVERQLRTRLFDRTSEGFAATEAGLIAITHAEAIEGRALALASEVEGSDARIEGPVCITALDALIDGFIIPHLPPLLARHPRLELTFSSDFRLLDLSRREAYIALRPSPPGHPDAVGRRLGRQASALYVARRAAFDGDPPIISYPRGMDTSPIATMLRAALPASRVAGRGNSESHIQSLVRAGIGVGLIDCFAGDPDPLLRRFRPEPLFTYDMWAVAHVDVRQLPRVRVILDFLTQLFSEHAELLAGNAAGQAELQAGERKRTGSRGKSPI